MKMMADYDLILERLSIQSLWDFPGGVKPKEFKTLSNTTPIAQLPLPEVVRIPVKQHIGIDGDIIVKVGDSVAKGQPLTASENIFAVPIHASTSGEVTAIDQHVAAHPSGIEELSITIKADGLDTQYPLNALGDYAKCEKGEIIEAICKAGISGMGGAGFPTHIKSNNVKPIEFLIINGIECEPYITSDDRLMREHAWQIRQGIDILCHVLQPKQVLIAVEDNKPEAFNTLSIACQQQDNYQLVNVPTKYPAGGEKQLIQVLTSREVPSDGLPVDVGCLMYNVGTCYAIADAVLEGKPLIERVVTITGKAVNEPQNVWARIGTPIKDLLSFAGYECARQDYPRIIMGGPMMGFTLSSVQVPVVKITNCILAPAKGELPQVEDERACIRCSACADACPVSLLPQQMFWHSKAKEYDKAQEYNLFDCIECGACAYVCPSEIPLVHYYRKAKADIHLQQQEKEKAEKARIRFESRKARLLKEKQAREEKHRLAAEARSKAMNKDGGAAKDKIAAALARAKAKKAALAEKQDVPAAAQSADAPAKPEAVEQKLSDTTNRDVKADVKTDVKKEVDGKTVDGKNTSVDTANSADAKAQVTNKPARKPRAKPKPKSATAVKTSAKASTTAAASAAAKKAEAAKKARVAATAAKAKAKTQAAAAAKKAKQASKPTTKKEEDKPDG